MSLIVEDGTGLSNAESYLSVADADSYHTLRVNTGWAGTTAEKEAALRGATEYLTYTYGQKWLGTKKTETQSLDFPRVDIVTRDNFTLPDDVLPSALKYATAELALRVRQGDVLLPDQDNPGTIEEYEVSVGPIKERTKYLGGQSQVKYYPVVSRMLAGLAQATNEIRRA